MQHACCWKEDSIEGLEVEGFVHPPLCSTVARDKSRHSHTPDSKRVETGPLVAEHEASQHGSPYERRSNNAPEPSEPPSEYVSQMGSRLLSSRSHLVVEERLKPEERLDTLQLATSRRYRANRMCRIPSQDTRDSGCVPQTPRTTTQCSRGKADEIARATTVLANRSSATWRHNTVIIWNQIIHWSTI